MSKKTSIYRPRSNNQLPYGYNVNIRALIQFMSDVINVRIYSFFSVKYWMVHSHHFLNINFYSFHTCLRDELKKEERSVTYDSDE